MNTNNDLNRIVMMNIKHKDVIEAPVNAEQVRARYKAIVNEKFKNNAHAKYYKPEMFKHKHNLKTILENTNATVIKGFWGVDFACNFCKERRKIPWELKQHNLEAHRNVGGAAISVKKVTDFIIRLDITNLKCQICENSLNSLEDLMLHLSDVHSKLIYKDIKNHIMPFKFDTLKDNLRCAICSKEFRYFKLLSEHMSEHYRNYECLPCERAFVNKQSLQQHRLRHRIGVFKCANCSKVFQSRPEKSIHERLHTKKKGVSAKIATDNSTKNESNTIDIMNIKPEEEVTEAPVNAEKVQARYKATVSEHFNIKGPLKCDKPDMFKHKHNLQTILENTNATVIKSCREAGFACNFCEEKRKIPWELKQHNLEAHSKEGGEAIRVKKVSEISIRLDITELICQLCKISLNTLEDLMHHLSNVHCKLIYTDIKNHIMPFKFDPLLADKLQCAICNKEFKYFKLLTEHMSEHYRNYECLPCGRAFVNEHTLRQHRLRHKIGVFKCAHCSEVFDSQPKKNVHERLHKKMSQLDKKSRKCPFCDELFSSKDLMLNHAAKIHGMGPTLYVCQACNKNYQSKIALVSHIKRYHLLERPHKCSNCEKAFFSRVELIQHTAIHTKLREYKCKICGKCFGRESGLYRHIKGHSGIRDYKCDSCKRDFANRTNYKIHMRNQHGIIV